MRTKFGRKLFSLKEIYIITVRAIRTMPQYRRAQKQGDIDQQLIERIMLAVTAVNGCTLCSFAHAKMALEAGLSNAEIEKMLAGESDHIPEEDAQAIMFAQHYADSRGAPSKKAWERVVETYGLPKAKGILGAVRVIMMGNAYGIPWSALLGRLKGKPDKRSSLPYELAVMIGCVVLIPSACLHALIAGLLRIPQKI